MFFKERILLGKIFDFYYDFNLLTNNKVEEYDFFGKLYNEIKNCKKFKIIIISILVINIIFKGILVTLNKEAIIEYIFLIIFSIFFYMLTLIVEISKENDILLLISTINSKRNYIKSKENINISNVKSIMEEYKDINMHLKVMIEYNEESSKEKKDLYNSFINLGRFLSIALFIVYIYSSFVGCGDLDGIIIFSILMVLGNLRISSLNNKVNQIINNFFQLEIDIYEKNITLLNNICKKLLSNDIDLAFQSYSEMLYMLLDLYQVSIEYEFLSNEDVTCLSKEYSIKINYSINKIKDNTTKNRVHKEYVKLRAFMKENSTEIYNGLETYIGKLYKNIKNSFPSKELKVEDYCFTIDELESLTLLCE